LHDGVLVVCDIRPALADILEGATSPNTLELESSVDVQLAFLVPFNLASSDAQIGKVANVGPMFP
jgi:hypothetical protein